MLKIFSIFALLLAVCQSENAWAPEEETTQYWYDLARKELDQALLLEKLNMNVARNVIIFLGDGMGIPSITAGRILKGQLRNASGEETELAMDKFHRAGLSKTYCVDKQVSDSAATATAFLCGVKTNNYLLGLSAKGRLRECSTEAGNEVNSILYDSFHAGKSTGIVTTTSINHATPAASYAHSASRTWYSDAQMSADALDKGCKDLATQFVESSNMFTVALGGGRRFFMPSSENDPEHTSRRGSRNDGKNLIAQWQNDHVEENAEYVWKKDQFDAIDPIATDKLLGLFETEHMQYEVDRLGDTSGEPSIAEMTEKAVRMLQKNSKGFFLLVEGGRIDHGHHASNAHTALHDVIAFDDAVAKAVELTSDSDTLIVVTADHSHTLNMGGYSDRGNPIFGLAPAQDDPSMGSDNKPYTTLLYGNGPGFQGSLNYLQPQVRENLTEIDTGARSYLQQSAVPLTSETHGGEDVTIMARGPMSHLFHTVHEQSYIAHVMRYASCVGGINDHCNAGSAVEETVTDSTESSVAAYFLGYRLDSSSAQVALYVQFVLLLCMTFFALFLAYLIHVKLSTVKNKALYSGRAGNNAYEKTVAL